MNLTVPSASQNSPGAQIQHFEPVISSLRDALDAAVSASIPALVKSAVKEATMSKPRSRGKRALSPSPFSSPLRRLRSPSYCLPASAPAKPNIWSQGENIDAPGCPKSTLQNVTWNQSSSCLNLHRTNELDSDSEQDRAEAFPKSEAHHTIFPFPKAFHSIFTQEWKSHSKGVGSKVVDRLYILPDKQKSLLKVPEVDAPVASLSSSSVPVDGDMQPKNCHRS